MPRIDPALVLHQIANLKIVHPDIWDDGDERLLTDCLEASTETHEFLRVVLDRIQDSTSMAGAIATRIADLELRQGRYTQRETALRDLAFRIMETAELKKLELAEGTLSIRNGTPRVIITDEALIPDVLCRIKREPDKKRIGEMLKDGQEVRGAEMSDAEPTLSIRVK